MGTLDLAWEFGGVFFSRNFICHDDDGVFTFRVCSPRSDADDAAPSGDLESMLADV